MEETTLRSAASRAGTTVSARAGSESLNAASTATAAACSSLAPMFPARPLTVWAMRWGAFVVAGVECTADVFYGAGVALPEFEQEIAIQVAVPRDTFESVHYVSMPSRCSGSALASGGNVVPAGGAGVDGGLIT